MNYEALAAALVAALILEKLFEAIFGPLWTHFKWDPFYKLYAALGIGAALGFLTGLNAFPVFALAPLAGRIMTALAIGAGTTFLYDLQDAGTKLPTITMKG